MEKIIKVILLTLAIFSTTTAYAEEASAKPTAITITNADVLPERLNFMVRYMYEGQR